VLDRQPVDLELSGPQADLTVGGELVVGGGIITGDDFYRMPAGAGQKIGGATDGESSGWGGVNLADAATQGIAFAQSYSLRWTKAALSWGFVPLAAPGGTSIRWRVRIRRVGALGFGGAANDEITDAPQEETLLTAATPNQNTMGHIFLTPPSFDVQIGPAALFGTVTQVSIERIGGDGADTFTGAVLLTNFSINRVL
jgi:hypothetical protein